MRERIRRWRPVLYFMQKEFRQVFRDLDMLRVVFMVPTIQLFVLCPLMWTWNDHPVNE